MTFLFSVPGSILLSLVLVAGASLPALLALPEASLLRVSLEAAAALIAFLFIPALLVWGHGEKLSDYGWRMPRITRKGLLLSLGSLALLLPSGLALATLPEFGAYYGDPERLSWLPLTLILLPLLYYAAEEFLFRGFLLRISVRRYGMAGIAITATFFALLHLGKPSLEVGYSFVLALCAALLTLESKSILPAVLLHALLALAVNLSALAPHLST
jgi:uncharacterized protein